MSQYDELCARLGVRADRAHMLRCPEHDDRTASLSIKRGDDGRALLYCFGGCDAKAVMDALDVCPSPARYVYTPSLNADEMTLEKEYQYTNADGGLVATKERYRTADGKSFRWKAEGGAPVDQSTVPLYNMHVLAGEQQDRLVWVVEGEKDVETLRSHGLIATCNPEGASGAKSAYAEPRWSELKGRNVCLIADNDTAGATHASKVADILRPLVKTLVVISPLPGVPTKGDATDFLVSHSIDDLKAIYSASLKGQVSAPASLPSQNTVTASTGLLEAHLKALEPVAVAPLRLVERIEYASWEREAQAMTSNVRTVPSPFPMHNDFCRKQAARQGMKLGWHVVVAGKPGFGKTTLGLNMVAHAALKGRRVGVCSLEMGKDEIMANLLSIATHTSDKELEAIPGQVNEGYLNAARTFDTYMQESGGGVYISEMLRSDLKTVRRAIYEMCEEGCELIMTDYMQLVRVEGKEDDYGRLTETSNTLRGMAKEKSFVSIALSQFNRGTSGTNFSPTGQGLKGSSAIEDDAGQILIIDNSRYMKLFQDGALEPWAADFDLKVEKNRYGPSLVNIPVRFTYESLTMHQRTV